MRAIRKRRKLTMDPKQFDLRRKIRFQTIGYRGLGYLSTRSFNLFRKLMAREKKKESSSIKVVVRSAHFRSRPFSGRNRFRVHSVKTAPEWTRQLVELLSKVRLLSRGVWVKIDRVGSYFSFLECLSKSWWNPRRSIFNSFIIWKLDTLTFYPGNCYFINLQLIILICLYNKNV